MHAPATGRYRHFKGGYYQVLALALHTETQEQLVVYQSEQDAQVVTVHRDGVDSTNSSGNG